MTSRYPPPSFPPRSNPPSSPSEPLELQERAHRTFQGSSDALVAGRYISEDRRTPESRRVHVPTIAIQFDRAVEAAR